MLISAQSAQTPRYQPKIVAVGDSLTAGMQDINLIGARQEVSYPALIARQAGLEFKQPLMDKQGIPPRLLLSPGTSLGETAWRYAAVSLAALPAWACMGLGFVPPEWAVTPLYHAGQMGQTQAEGMVQNLAIPGFELRELTDVANVKDLMRGMADDVESSGKLVAIGPYVRNILQENKAAKHGKSQIDRAVEQDPDMVIFWAGNNDALQAALNSDVCDRNLTPMKDQRWSYTSYNPITGKRSTKMTKTVQPGFETSLVGPQGSLTRLLKETEAEVMVMNIPDVTTIPFLHKMGDKVGPLPFRVVLPGGLDVTAKLENWKLPMAIKGEGKDGRTHFPENTYVGLPMLLAKLTHYFQVDSEEDVDKALSAMNRDGGAFTEDEVLDPKELELIQKRTAEFNQLLKDLADKEERIHLVDTNAMLRQAAEKGIVARGEGPEVTLTNTFTQMQDERGFTGMFSGDGIHPSDVGYAVLANQILDKVRADLSEDERFQALVEAPPVDEKAALKTDPHHQAGRPTLMLTSYVTERLLDML